MVEAEIKILTFFNKPYKPKNSLIDDQTVIQPTITSIANGNIRNKQN